RGEVVVARVGLDMVDEFLDAFRRHRRMDRERSRKTDCEHDGREILVGIEGYLVKQRWIDDEIVHRDQQRVAVRRSFRDLCGCDISAGARDVLDTGLAAKIVVQFLLYEAGS